ncbi:MAG: alpha/beta hydrolase [SAR202 cluster bacterium]|nr:alpha/beta hydrolase [SAR202 cluster bacterium]
MPNPRHWSSWIAELAGKPVDFATPTSVEQIRASARATGALLESVGTPLPIPDLARVHERVVLRERQGVPLTAEVYVPRGPGPFPVFLYLHGGGWTGGSARAVRGQGMRLAAQGFTVVNLEYGLAPEHPFPWAVEDCIYAARWAVRNASSLDGDPRELFIGGESAGANLSAATIVALTGDQRDGLDEGDLAGVPVNFGGAVLFYGVFDFPLTFREPGGNVGSIEVRWNQAYLGPHFLKLHWHPLVSPIYAPNLANFPPTYLSCGDRDALLGQSLAMTKALAEGGVPVTLSVVSGLDHAFTGAEHLLASVREEIARICSWLAERRAAKSAGIGQSDHKPP